MLAGFSEIEFTPAEGNMPGQFKPYYAKGTKSPLMAHAAALTSGDSSVILISVDIIFVSNEFSKDAKEKISKATGVPFDNIYIMCTHTHTGCGTDVTCWLTPAEYDTAEKVKEAVVASAIEAWGNRAEAKLGAGRGYDTRFSFVRDFYLTTGELKTNPGRLGDGLLRAYYQPDQSVNVIRIDDMNGEVQCFIVNYSTHPDNNHQRHRDKFAGDYPGFMRAALRREFGEHVAVLFFQGTCGDGNSFNFYDNDWGNKLFKDTRYPCEIIGEGLAETVKQVSDDICVTYSDPFIQTRHEIVPLKRRFASPEMIEWARDILKREEAGEEIHIRFRLLARQYLEEEDPTLPDTVDMDVYYIQLGPMVVVGFPAELYTEIGMRIKANSPFALTAIAELTNGTNGYCSSDIAQVCGTTYEGTYSKALGCMGLGSVDALVNAATDMLEEMNIAELERYTEHPNYVAQYLKALRAEKKK